MTHLMDNLLTYIFSTFVLAMTVYGFTLGWDTGALVILAVSLLGLYSNSRFPLNADLLQFLSKDTSNRMTAICVLLVSAYILAAQFLTLPEFASTTIVIFLVSLSLLAIRKINVYKLSKYMNIGVWVLLLTAHTLITQASTSVKLAALTTALIFLALCVVTICQSHIHKLNSFSHTGVHSGVTVREHVYLSRITALTTSIMAFVAIWHGFNL